MEPVAQVLLHTDPLQALPEHTYMKPKEEHDCLWLSTGRPDTRRASTPRRFPTVK